MPRKTLIIFNTASNILCKSLHPFREYYTDYKLNAADT